MASAHPIQHLTIDEYLAVERDGDVRHEYIEGEVFAMTGASRAHNRIAGNLFITIDLHLRGTPCRTFINDMKVKVGTRFYYPDLMVSCSDVTDEPDDYYETSPKLIIEVLSKSTEADDRKHKRLAYQQLPSLQDYILVSQTEQKVEIFRRRPSGWLVETCVAQDRVKLQSIDLELSMPDIYRDVLTSDR